MRDARFLPGLIAFALALSCAPASPPAADGGTSTPPADAGGGKAPKTGEKGGACYGNGACDPGLECQNDVCAEPSSAEQGEEGGACYGNGTCNPGLECRDDVCTAPSSGEEGEEGGPCYGNGTCNTGLDCRDDVCTAPSTGEEGEEGGACYGNGTCNPGLVCEADVCVSSSPPDGGPDGGDDSGPPPSPPVITSFTADDAAVVFGAHTTLRWTTSGALSCTIPELGQVLVNGNQPVTPTASTVYELTCTNADGSSSSTVSVGLLPPTIDTFTADLTTIDYGAAAALTWTSTGAAGCTLAPDVGEVSTSGTRNVSPTEDTVYELTCSHPEASDTATLELTVNPPVRITSFTSSAETAPLRDLITLSWETTDATSCTLDGEPVAVAGSAEVPVTAWPDEVNTYTLTCEGIAGPAVATVTVTTAPAVVYDGDIVLCGEAAVCTVTIPEDDDDFIGFGGLVSCDDPTPCTPAGTLADLAAANIVTGTIVLNAVAFDAAAVERLISAKTVALQDVTAAGDIVFPSLRSVEDAFSVNYGGLSVPGGGIIHPIDGDVAEILLPRLETVPGTFSVYAANPSHISAPALATVATRFWVQRNDAQCLTLSFPALTSVGGAGPLSPPEGFNEFTLTQNRTTTFVGAFSALTVVNGHLRVIDLGASDADAEAAFPPGLQTGERIVLGAEPPTCP